MKGFKHRINQIFRPADTEVVASAVKAVHEIASNVSLLIKYRLLKKVDASACRDAPPLIIDEDAFETAVIALSGMVRVRNRGSTDDVAIRKANQESWIADYREMLSERLIHRGREDASSDGKKKKPSVSPMMDAAAKQYCAAVLTNIRYHFRDYVRKAMKLVLISVAATLEGVGRFQNLPSNVQKRWRREFGKAYDDVLFHRRGHAMLTDQRLRRTVERHRDRLVPPLPPGVPTIDSDLDSDVRPFVYLGYMVRITKFLEAAGGTRLSSPVPLKTSFVPSHYSIDTTALLQLLMNGDRIAKFKNYFQHCVKGGFALPGLTSKANLTATLSKLAGRPVTEHDEELFKDAAWAYLCGFRNRRTKLLNPLCHKSTVGQKERFDHSISTDGYSVTMMCSDREIRGRKRLFRSAVRRRVRTGCGNGKDQEFPSLDSGTTREWLETLDMHMSTFVGGDPGKGVLLQLVDECDRRLRYTSGQRNSDTLRSLRERKQHNARHRSIRGVVQLPRIGNGIAQSVQDPSAADLERVMRRMGISPRTVCLQRFRRYVAFRDAARGVFDATYSLPVFRGMRFLAWSRRRLSVMKFIERIVEKYGNAGPIVIFYGDWGRAPNLKHQAPTPGICLRRLIHQRAGIVTITVRETYTSSFCARRSCQAEVEEAVRNGRRTHALLGCQACGVTWRRDVLGAMNILDKGLHLMRSYQRHPLFGI